jgi:hypothetical protein
MDHVSVKIAGVGPNLGPRSPSDVGQCVHLPRFDARETGSTKDCRGFGIRVYQSPAPGGTSHFTAVADSEMLPNPNNRVTLSRQRDYWGFPTLRIAASHGPHELNVAREQIAALNELLDLLSIRQIGPVSGPAVPGSAIHECGTARMGDDPESSVLDPFNQVWEAPGIYVTDGACFPSEGLVNPTLTIMALTARACDHAVRSH